MSQSDRRPPRGTRALAWSALALVVGVATLLTLDAPPRLSPADPPRADHTTQTARPDPPAQSDRPDHAGPSTAGPSEPASSTEGPRPDASDRRTVLVGTLNALGAGHASDRSWGQRTRALVRLLRRHGLGSRAPGLSIIGLQEFTPRQVRVLRRELVRRNMSVAVVASGWDRAVLVDRHTWLVRRRGTLPLPYGPGAVRPNPAAILEHRATGATTAAASVHLPALPRMKQPALMRQRRAAGFELIARRAERWHDQGHAVLVLGDFNQREVPAAVRDSLRTGWGGTTTPIIDWVLGSRDRWEWQRNRIDRRTRRRAISDHLLVLQELRLTATGENGRSHRSAG